jgi:4-methyl-5(b-hydroxyethyl)-thiazole monophosphate biosynthesis
MPKVLVPLAEGFEELEAVTITDLLTRAKIGVVTAGLKPGPVKASRGTTVIPDTDLDAALKQEYDMIVLPGGQPGANNLEGDQRILSVLKNMRDNGKLVAAICAAPKALATAGVLDNKNATCFPGSIDTDRFSTINLISDDVAIDGNIITSRGPGTAMDFALTLIERLAGADTRNKVEAALQRPVTHIQH